MNDLVRLYIDHSENIHSLIYADFSNVDISHYTISKNYIHKHYHQPYQQSLLNKLSSSHGRYYFQNSNFHKKAQILSLATDTVSCFPWVTDSLCIFGGNVFQVPKSEWPESDCQSFLQARMVSQEKPKLFGLQFQPSPHKCFSLRQTSYFMWQNTVCLLPSSHRTLKICMLKGLRFSS